MTRNEALDLLSRINAMITRIDINQHDAELDVTLEDTVDGNIIHVWFQVKSNDLIGDGFFTLVHAPVDFISLHRINRGHPVRFMVNDEGYKGDLTE